jgi:hypothetical protein
MTKAQLAIQDLEAKLEAFTKESETWDMAKAQHPVKWFARMSFYQAEAFKKVFERLDEIEEMIAETTRRSYGDK